MVTSTDLFDALLGWLRERYEILTLSELIQRPLERTRGRQACSLTFDDGWCDNYTHAFPILQKHGAPASIFLATGFIGTTRRFWQERLFRCSSVRGFAEAMPDVAAGHLPERPVQRDFGPIRRMLMTVPTAQADAFVAALEKSLALPVLERAFMDWGEVKVMKEGGVEFGGHTINHIQLPLAAPDVARNEILGCKSEIETRLGGAVRTFAYPWGRHSDAIRGLVAEAGYGSAVSTRNAFADSASDRFALPRIFISDSALTDSAGRFGPGQLNAYLASTALGVNWLSQSAYGS